MKKNSLKRVIALLMLSTVFLWFDSCRKSASGIADGVTSNDERMIAAIKKKIAPQGEISVLASNQKATSYISDPDGNDLRKLYTSGKAMTTCLDNNGDQIYGFDETVLESCTRSFLCGQGYTITSSWLITTELPLVVTGSKGRMRLKDINNAVIYTNTSITPVSITPLTTVNSNYPNATVYRVVYQSPVILETIYESCISLENGVLLLTSCPTTETVQYLATFSIYIGGTSTNPCSRVDEVFFNPAASGMPASVAGCNTTTICNISGYTLPGQQDIAFLPISTDAVAKTVTINSADVKLITPVTPPSPLPIGWTLPADLATRIYVYAGVYQIQYRNNASCGLGPWSDPAQWGNLTFR